MFRDSLSLARREYYESSKETLKKTVTVQQEETNFLCVPTQEDFFFQLKDREAVLRVLPKEIVQALRIVPLKLPC